MSEVASPPSGAATPEHERRARHGAGRRARRVPRRRHRAGHPCSAAATGSPPGSAPTPRQARSSGGPRTPCCSATSPSPCCAGSPPKAAPSAATPIPPAPRGPGRCSCGRCAPAASSTPAAPACSTCSPPAPPACPTTCSARPSPSGCPGGASPRRVADGLIKPFAAARAVVPLAAAAEEAHRHGLVLGCDHPQRVRVNPDGNAQMCFALPRPDLGPPTTSAASAPSSTPCSRRAGRCRSPTPPARASARPSESTVSCLPRPRNGPACPSSWTRSSPGRSVRPGAPGTCTPPPRSTGCSTRSWPRTTASRCSRPSPTASRPARATSGKTAPAPARRTTPSGGASCWSGWSGSRSPCSSCSGSSARRWARCSSDSRGAPVIVVDNDAPPPRRARPRRPRRPHWPGGAPVAVAGIEVYDPTGDSDNAGRVSRVIDGNVAPTGAPSSTSSSFPALKPGVGIMVSFASAVQLTAVTVESPSPGTVIQVRSAQAADAALDDTTRHGRRHPRRGRHPDLVGREPAGHPRPAVDHQAGRGRLGEHHADQRGAVPPRGRLTDPRLASGHAHRPATPRDQISPLGHANRRSLRRVRARVSPNGHGGPIRRPNLAP